MLPWLLFINAITFAALLLAVAVPPLYFQFGNANDTPTDSYPVGNSFPGRNAEGEIVWQRLYILFAVPLCGCLNGLFLYFTYYRHMRHMQFRVELCCTEQRNLKTALFVFLHKKKKPSGMFSESEEEGNFSADLEGNWRLPGDSFIRGSFSFQPKEGKAPPIRTEGLSHRAYSTTPWLPELRELQDIIASVFIQRADKLRDEVMELLHETVLMHIERDKGLTERSIQKSILLLLQQKEELSVPVMTKCLKQIEIEGFSKVVS